jgi:uncharacterized protein with PIN domain
MTNNFQYYTMKFSIGHIEPMICYAQEFKRCTDCDQLYWQGSHHEKIKRWLENTLSL